MKTQTRITSVIICTFLMILAAFPLFAADKANGTDRIVIAPNEPPPVAQNQYGYNPDPDELTLVRGKYAFVLGDILFFDPDKTRYLAVPTGYLMDELKYQTPLFLVTQVKPETFLIKQINPEVDTMTIATYEGKISPRAPQSL